MPLGLQAIRSKHRPAIDTSAVLAAALAANLEYGQRLQEILTDYPPQQPTKRPYKRTGDLGRGWIAPGALKATPQGMTLVNRTPYSVYVQGPRPGQGKGTRQTSVMRSKGWKSLSDVARATVKDYATIVNRRIAGRPG